MKKALQPVVRKVYGTPQQQQQSNSNSVQMNAVRKINNLLQSGAVSVTGPNQPRILKQKVNATGSTIATSTPIKTLVTPTTGATSTPSSPSSVPAVKASGKVCFVCEDNCTSLQSVSIAETQTITTQTKLPNKIARLIGEEFMVIIGTNDIICRRCVSLINQMDKLEFEFDRIRKTFVNYLNKKYSLFDDDMNDSHTSEVTASPPTKIQKLNSGGTVPYNSSEAKISVAPALPRKIAIANNSKDNLDKQLSSMFDSSNSSPTASSGAAAQSSATTTTTSAGTTNTTTTLKRGIVKMYKCISCEFKTADLAQFQPHYETCKQQASTSAASTTASPQTLCTYRCQHCRKTFTSAAAVKQHSAEQHPNLNVQMQAIEKTEVKVNSNEKIVYSCNMCQYKTYDKPNYDEHVRKHIKLKPFKCRICLSRFETREQASIHAKTHQPDYFKCGVCSVTFPKREQLMKHLEVHDKGKTGKPGETLSTKVTTSSTSITPSTATTQKLLQDTINEALRDTNETIDAKTIQFHQCLQCSLTFLNETLYSQHMKMHNSSESNTSSAVSGASEGSSITTTAASGHGASSRTQTVSSTTAKAGQVTNKKTIISVNNSTGTITTTTTTSKAQSKIGLGNKKVLTSANNSQNASAISDGDLESIFEKMHSDKADTSVSSGNGDTNIKQENGSEISFNISIPEMTDEQNKNKVAGAGIDMPTLDQTEDSHEHTNEEDSDQQEDRQHQIVNMPNLDDDGEDTQNSQSSNPNQVAMDLEELQNAAGGEGIKYILSENGQLLQIDNHILTTDADGNQILVQGTDSEQIQQLLQSVGVVMQGGEGETIQMLGDNNQMILVQGGDGQEAQLIDASMLNADGNIVIQQSQQGELNAEGTHITTEDGIQIPVSVAFAAAAQQHLESGAEGPLTVSVSAGEDGQTEQIQLHHIEQHSDNNAEEKPNHENQDKNTEDEEEEQDNEEEQGKKGGEGLNSNDDSSTQEDNKLSTSSETPAGTEGEQQDTQTANTSGEVFFNLDEIIQPGSNQDK